MFYANGDRYDGLWLDDKPHNEGRMIYSNGDVYEGILIMQYYIKIFLKIRLMVRWEKKRIWSHDKEKWRPF